MWFLPCFFCMSPTWGQLRCSKVTLGLANSAPGPRCLQMAVEIREFPLTGHPSSPSQSDSRWGMLPFQMNTGWKRHRQTEATLSPCAKCAGKAGAKPGCVNGSASPLILALGQGSLPPTHRHPTAQPSGRSWCFCSSCWRRRIPQGMCSSSPWEYALPARAVLVPRIPQRSHVGLFLPLCQLGLLGSLAAADWVVDLSGPERLPPAIRANKRPLSSRAEQRAAVGSAMLLLRN